MVHAASSGRLGADTGEFFARVRGRHAIAACNPAFRSTSRTRTRAARRVQPARSMARAIPQDGAVRVPGVAPARYRWTGSAGGVRLGRILNIEIDLDFSVLIIFGLIVFNLGAGMLPSWHPGWSGPLTWMVATFAGAAVLASILAHELSHALV